MLKVLIAEDNSAIRMVLGEMMKSFSREVLFAQTGEEAVTSVRDNPDIDLIMMDTYMPMMNGSEATKRIRQFNKKVLIIVVSAFPLSEITEEFAGIAIDDYFPKPFNKVTLNELMVKHFDPTKLD
jgi:two-component system, sensor histidine kinase